jgi:hypothetical protein
MSAHSDEGQESFLGRWSRVKAEARDSAAKAPAQTATAPAPVGRDEAPPELPPVEKLTFDSDFTGFFHPKVDEGLRRQALRKLFSDPRFNVMDGLDVYIDDYSKTEPIPAAMLAGLQQAQRILEWAAEKPRDAHAPEQAAVVTDQIDTPEALPAEPAEEPPRCDVAAPPLAQAPAGNE